MALASLRFQRNAQDHEESRQGVTYFAGDAPPRFTSGFDFRKEVVYARLLSFLH